MHSVQIATAAILFTGANTSFNGFPALANFVAEDRFLPRQLTKRGQRLVFSNGIIVLTALSIVLLIVTGGSVNALVPFYAIGVFTGFAMAGYGMTKYHLTHQDAGLAAPARDQPVRGRRVHHRGRDLRHREVHRGRLAGGRRVPVAGVVLMRLNREYRAEAAILEMFRTNRPDTVKYARHRVFVLVNGVDLAVLEALRYGRGLRADDLTAVHFMIDAAVADRLRKRWEYFGIETPLRIIDCPDRRHHPRRAGPGVQGARRVPQHQRHGAAPAPEYAPLLGRLLHDRTADKISAQSAESRTRRPRSCPTTCNPASGKRSPDLLEERVARELEKLQSRMAQRDQERVDEYEHPDAPPERRRRGMACSRDIWPPSKVGSARSKTPTRPADT